MAGSESDCSEDEQNGTMAVKSTKRGGSMREEGLHADSNENSSLRGAPPSSVANGGGGGRPQRRSKSKYTKL